MSFCDFHKASSMKNKKSRHKQISHKIPGRLEKNLTKSMGKQDMVNLHVLFNKLAQTT